MDQEESSRLLGNVNFWKGRIRRGLDPERVLRAVEKAAAGVAKEQEEARQEENIARLRELRAELGLTDAELLGLLQE